MPTEPPEAEKSGSNSGTKRPGTFQPGDDPRRGRGPPPGSGGRPPDAVKALFEELATDPANSTTLRKILQGDGVTVTETALGVKVLNVDIPSYLRAHQYVVERHGGKPAQTIQGPDGGPVQVQLLNGPGLE